jgi:hypothetical protein
MTARTDCGEDAYVARDKITNVDGVVNNAALAALRAGRFSTMSKASDRRTSSWTGITTRRFFSGRDTASGSSLWTTRPSFWLATPEQKDDRIRITDELRMNGAHGREVLSDGWLWDMSAQAPDVRSLGQWSELIVVVPHAEQGRGLELELSAIAVAEPAQVQVVHVTVDGATSLSCTLSWAHKWCPVDVPFDDRRHRIRLEYESPKLRVERVTGARWWWRGIGYQVNAVLLWGLRVSPRSDAG